MDAMLTGGRPGEPGESGYPSERAPLLTLDLAHCAAAAGGVKRLHEPDAEVRRGRSLP